MNDVMRPILLVEDNPMDLELTRRAFAKHRLGNPLLVARDGVEALEMLPRWESGEPLPLVVLLDLKLPRLDGLDRFVVPPRVPLVGADTEHGPIANLHDECPYARQGGTDGSGQT